MREIQLTKGYVALVDDADYDVVAAYKWTASMNRKSGKVYARRSEGRRCFYMHRQLLGNPKGKIVDHYDLDGLNNQRLNLRACKDDQNQSNKAIQANNSSGRKGVCFISSRGKFEAKIGKKNKLFIGHFDTADEAALAYDAAARKRFGEFARVNFPCQGEMAA